MASYGWKDESGYVVPLPNSQAVRPTVHPVSDDQVCQIAGQFDIESRYASQLKCLSYYDIVIILDDSGSMIAPSAGFVSRWEEAHQMLKIISELLMSLKGVDTPLTVLNRTEIRTTGQILSCWNDIKPAGPTPIRSAFNNLEIGNEVPTLIFLITDGEPSLPTKGRDGRFENKEDTNFYEFLQDFQVRHSKVYLNVILCTSSEGTVRFWKKIDKMQRVDVVDDYETEQKRCRGRMSFGTYVAKAMLGSVVPELDADEVKCCTIV